MSETTNKTNQKIQKAMQEFILNNYGRKEAEDPCYDLKEMSKFIANRLNNDKNNNGVEND